MTTLHYIDELHLKTYKSNKNKIQKKKQISYSWPEQPLNTFYGPSRLKPLVQNVKQQRALNAQLILPPKKFSVKRIVIQNNRFKVHCVFLLIFETIVSKMNRKYGL